MEIINQEVRFDQHCLKCVHRMVQEEDEPCNECLEHPTREYTCKPLNYKEAKS